MTHLAPSSIERRVRFDLGAASVAVRGEPLDREPVEARRDEIHRIAAAPRTFADAARAIRRRAAEARSRNDGVGTDLLPRDATETPLPIAIAEGVLAETPRPIAIAVAESVLAEPTRGRAIAAPTVPPGFERAIAAPTVPPGFERAIAAPTIPPGFERAIAAARRSDRPRAVPYRPASAPSAAISP